MQTGWLAVARQLDCCTSTAARLAHFQKPLCYRTSGPTLSTQPPTRQAHSLLPAPTLSRSYELLAKLRGATGRDSEDAKAPLKAIRNAVDQAAFNT